MCLAIPMQVKAVEGSEAVVTQGGTELRVRTDLLDAVEVSDYVLVHAGFALQVVDPQEAMATLAMLRQMAEETPREGEAHG